MDTNLNDETSLEQKKDISAKSSLENVPEARSADQAFQETASDTMGTMETNLNETSHEQMKDSTTALILQNDSVAMSLDQGSNETLSDTTVSMASTSTDAITIIQKNGNKSSKAISKASGNEGRRKALRTQSAGWAPKTTCTERNNTVKEHSRNTQAPPSHNVQTNPKASGKGKVKKEKGTQSMTAAAGDTKRSCTERKYTMLEHGRNTQAPTSYNCLREHKGDLFSCPDTDSLAHCVSRDLHMGKGIAKIFKKEFGHEGLLREQDKNVGEVAVLKHKDRFVYYLITKVKYFFRPTNDALEASLKSMKEHCIAHNVKSVSMPRIGCGLDRLDWSDIEGILIKLFKDTDIVINIYSL